MLDRHNRPGHEDLQAPIVTRNNLTVIYFILGRKSNTKTDKKAHRQQASTQPFHLKGQETHGIFGLDQGHELGIHFTVIL